MSESLYWLTYNEGTEPAVLLQWAHSLVAARLRGALAGTPGEFVDGFRLDAATATKVPREFIGRLISANEAEALLEKLDARSAASGNREADQ